MSARDRIALSVVAGALLLAGLWFLLVSPKREEASQLGQQVTEAQAVLDQARNDLGRFQQARAGYRDNYAVLAAVGKAAPAEDATASLLFQIGATARSEKVDFRSFTAGQAPADAATAEATQTLPAEPFSFDYVGPFFRLSDFLGGLQRYVEVEDEDERLAVDGRLLRIDGFSLGEAEPGSPPQVSVQATAFTLPEGQSALGGATPAGPAGATSAAPPAEGGTGAPATATVTGGTP
ncbi:MAG: type II secretion system protein GspM [Solirubrobacteraceae bacterium MAG38_C4-C5]|nr:type II secretion system protein GspM [Candidatus Siliceabacter maunaloa]